MRHLVAACVCLVAFITFSSLTLLSAQAKDGAKCGKADAKKDPMTAAEYEKFMKGMQDEWNKLKINARKKMGAEAAKNADAIAGMCPDILRYHKKEAREAKDFKDWVAELEKQAKEFSKTAKKSDWDGADKAKEKIGEACGDCHDKYQPEEE